MFLVDGYSTLIVGTGYSTNGAVIAFREKEVQPPDVDGGGEIDTTTMRNLLWHSASPKALLKLGQTKLQVQYDPFMYNQIVVNALINRLWTVIFPDAATLGFYGWLDKFTPTSHKEGEFPLAEIILFPSMMSPGGGLVIGPVLIQGRNTATSIGQGGAFQRDNIIDPNGGSGLNGI